MKQPAIVLLVIMLLSVSFGCDDDGDDNKDPEAWLTLEPPEAVIYDNSTGFSYPEIQLNGNESNDPDGRITYYLFDMGEGNTTQGGEGDNTTTHEYRIAGYFKVSLEVEDNNGAKDTATKELSINYQMNHVGGPLDEGDSEEEPFTITEFSPNNGNATVTLSHDGLPGSSSDAKVSILNQDDVEVRAEERQGITSEETVIFDLVTGDFNTHGLGQWKLVVECTSGGTITYDCQINIFYKD